jgi:hypothetical protein
MADNAVTGNKVTGWALTDLSGLNRNIGIGNAFLGGNVSLRVNNVVIPISQLSMTYGLNSIPTATAIVALGRNARTQEPSPIYSQIDSIQQMAPVTVIINGRLGDWTAAGTGGQKRAWPTTNAVIFVGYVSGISYRRSAGRVSLVINLINQLVDLTMSSGASADVVPGTPGDLLLPLLFEGSGGTGVGTAASKFVEELPVDMDKDFSKGILKALHFVSQTNQLQIHEAWCGGRAAPNPTNNKQENKRAAQAIEGTGFWYGIAPFANKDYGQYIQPYPFQIHTKGKNYTAERIGETIASSILGTSMWNMLIMSLLPSFGCAVVPIAQTAFIAPILPMSKVAAKAIEPDEYVDFNFSMMSQRPLYGVAVMSNYVLGSLSSGDPNSPASQLLSDEEQKMCVGASFTAKANNDSTLNDGMWMFVRAPSWMDDWTNFDPEAADGQAAVNNMLNNPAHDATGANQPAAKRDPNAEVPAWNDVMKKYAQLIYAENALRDRGGVLVGKLRFDISPGTTLKIRCEGDIQSQGVDSLATNLYGMVTQVTVSINAEQAAATTTFELSHLRTEAENESPRFSMLSHPFFPKHFEYAPLVPALTVQ